MGLFDSKEKKTFKYPGTRVLCDGTEAVGEVEKHLIDGAAVYPITPSTGMAEFQKNTEATGFLGTDEKPQISYQLEGEHAMFGGEIGLASMGMRVSSYSSAQGIAYGHEQFYVMGKVPLMVHIAARPMTKSTLNVHAGHDDYHCVDDAGLIQFFCKNNQEVADMTLIARKVSELSLTPVIVAQDGFLTSHLMKDMLMPERELIKKFCGLSSDIIDSPTPAQRMTHGPKRRRVPILMDVDNPAVIGAVTNQDIYMQTVAGNRPFKYDHVKEITEACMKEYGDLTGRYYHRVGEYKTEDAEYLLVGQGSIVEEAEAVADYMRTEKGVKVGVVNMTMFRPFPGDLITHILKGKKGVTVLERLDQPLAEDLPIIREIRASLTKAVENGKAKFAKETLPYPNYAVYANVSDVPVLYSCSFGMGSRDTQPGHLIAMVDNMTPKGKKLPFYYSGIEFVRDVPFNPAEALYQQEILDAYPHLKTLALPSFGDIDLMPKDSLTVQILSRGGWGAMATGKSIAMSLFELDENCHVTANPLYGSEKKNAPTRFYIAMAQEPIKMMCVLRHLDVIMSPDDNVFKHTNALAGLKKNGVFIIQSDLKTPKEVWDTFPEYAKKYIKENAISVFSVDGFKIAREEASKPEHTYRMQGIAFQGSFFATSSVAEKNNLTKEQVLAIVYQQLDKKFGKKDKNLVEDNFRVVKRGFTEVTEVTYK
jgi:pyruvate-ferredoxin/flavodoxin oxidoreductase